MSTDTELPALHGTTWDAVTEKWLQSYIDKVSWRYHPEMDEDDLRQEALIVWLKLKTRYDPDNDASAFRYPGEKDTPEMDRHHFFRLFQNSVKNRFLDLQDKFSRRRKRMLSATGDTLDDYLASEYEPERTMDAAPAPENTADQVLLQALINDAPEPIRSLLRAEISAAELPWSEDGTSSVLPLRGPRKRRIARAAGVSEDQVDALNEEIERWAREKFAKR